LHFSPSPLSPHTSEMLRKPPPYCNRRSTLPLPFRTKLPKPSRFACFVPRLLSPPRLNRLPPCCDRRGPPPKRCASPKRQAKPCRVSLPHLRALRSQRTTP